jgi:hypothetical protein
MAIWRVMAVVGLGVVAQGAVAQDWAGAIAFAQAPEQSGGVATAATVEEAIAAAMAECVAGGAPEENCFITAACEPAGWSVDIFLQHQEGPHWHEMICGIAEEGMIEAMATAVCDAEVRPYLIECAVVQVRDPSGIKQMEN